MYKNPVLGHGPILGIDSFLVSQLQHFHWRFVLQPGKKTKEEDVEKLFKLGPTWLRAQGLYSCLNGKAACGVDSWRREPRWLLCRHAASWHRSKFSLKKKKNPHLKWKFSTLFFGSTQTRPRMEARTQEPLLMAILISFSKYRWGFVLYNDSEWRPPTSLWSHSHTHTTAHTAIFRVMQY